jgi:hypothetical protein
MMHRVLAAIVALGFFAGQGQAAFVGSPAQYAVVIGGTADQLAAVAPGTAGIPLTSQGAAANPSFAVCTVVGGCTGLATITAHTLLIGNGTSNPNLTTATAGAVLAETTTSADPAFTATPTLGVVSTTAGTLTLASATTAFSATIQAPGITPGSYNFNLPLTAGTTGQALTSAGGGSANMTWSAVASWVNTDYTSNTATLTLAATNWLFETVAQGTPAALTVNLPSAPANLTYQCVKDRANNFATFAATVKTTDSSTIDMTAGATGIVMNQKNQSLCFLFQSAIGANGNWAVN